MAVELWLSYNNGAEKLRLPVNPETVNVNSPFENADVSIRHFGEYTIIGERGSVEFSFESFFPSYYNPVYCEYSDFPTPSECISTIERWRDERKPLRFIVTGSHVNYAITIREFSYEVQRAGNPGDVFYSLSLKEYRFLDTSATPKNVTEKPKPSNKQRPPVVNKGTTKQEKTYTIKYGDTLSKVFGKDWRKVYEANRKVIGNNPNIIKPGQKLVLPS
ncbi:LysM peptidoglycan-binding domain-containing protein [Heyndrickxia oleronia]|uniref:LysM peptidoglycan-binding domain-containing protein n=1 Tax=Heyndrickxia oleronia TaxID=38875 RepID=A0AAW6SUY3_9BACI|nr:LysM peptidoglycan-binding domain-containing protein [Heyndrickxia oleronia]MDH5159816.1 LysM peptidoglycan-binding domain-containing protein [Heyndrickxia oleronia]